jgi:hypothetical protein
MAVRSYFDVHLSVNSTLPASQSYFKWIHTSQALLMAIKLSACKADGWDYHFARETLNFTNTADILIQKIECLIKLRGQRVSSCSPTPLSSKDPADQDTDVFARYLRHATCLRTWYERNFTPKPITPSLCGRPSSSAELKSMSMPWQPLRAMAWGFGEFPEDFMMGVDCEVWRHLYETVEPEVEADEGKGRRLIMAGTLCTLSQRTPWSDDNRRNS